MTTFITINGKRTEIEEPEINKLCIELTRLITVAEYWNNKQSSMLLKICLKARSHKKMIYGHPKNASTKDKDFNTFYSDNYATRNDGYSIFISSISIQINDAEVTPAEAYIKLIETNMCNFKRNNPFGVKRSGNFFKGYVYSM